jgi:hypothetical protein
MKISNRAFTGIEAIGVVVVLGSILMFGKSVYNHLPFLPHGTKPNPIQVALVDAKLQEAKIGQQYAAATGQKLAQSTSPDPAVSEAKQLSAKADTALALGIGPLSADQSQWVQSLVLKHDVAFQAAIDSKDAQLSTLDAKAQDLQKKLNESQGSESLLWYWIKFAAVAYILIHFVFPLIATKFPAFGVISNGLHAVFSPIIADLRVKETAALDDLKTRLGSSFAEARTKLGATAQSVIQVVDGFLQNTPHQADIAAAAVDAAAAAAADKAKQAINNPS